MVYTAPENEIKRINPINYALTLAFGAVTFLAVGMQLMLGSMYQGKIYPGVQVSGVNLGGKNLAQAQDILEQQTNSFTLSIGVGDKQYRISTEELGAKYDHLATAQAAYLVGRDHSFIPLGMLEAYSGGSVSYAYALDKAAQTKFVQKVVAETGTAPVNAEVVAVDGKFEVKPDKDGVAVDPEELTSRLEEAVASTNQATFRIDPKPQPAPIKTADTAPAIEEAKKLVTGVIELTYEGKLFKPSAKDMGEWISFDQVKADSGAKLQPRVDAAKVKDYVLRLANGINKPAVSRKIRIENGVTSEERAGQDGLVVDDGVVTTKIAEAVAGKKALSMTIPTKPVTFKTEYNKVVTLDYGQYIEINISKQRLWAYQDKKVVFETPITSGAAGAGFPTVQGLFSIYNKQTNRNLNGYAIGYNYNVFVKYWMPFSGNFGLHDASWRGAFGGADYYYGGSHGCVNMPEHAAAFLYGWAPVGTPVWVHS